jgi:hypothetical protein
MISKESVCSHAGADAAEEQAESSFACASQALESRAVRLLKSASAPLLAA